MLIVRMHKAAPVYKSRIEFWLTLNILLANAAINFGFWITPKIRVDEGGAKRIFHTARLNNIKLGVKHYLDTDCPAIFCR